MTPQQALESAEKLGSKELIVFDFDGTLAKTKTPIDKQMMALLTKLLAVKHVAIIGGGKYEVFKELLVKPLKVPPRLLKNLFLFPATSTAFYRFDRSWKSVYSLTLPKAERARIKKSFEQVFKEIGYMHPPKTYGTLIEDRGTQVTFSALGQDVVAVLGKKKGVALKEEWKEKNAHMKMKIVKALSKKLPHLEVHAAGHTSIDVTKKGIDKAYGLRQIEKYLHVKIKNMLFVGDAIFPGGNDYAVTKTKVDYIKVANPEETKKIIRAIVKNAE